MNQIKEYFKYVFADCPFRFPFTLILSLVFFPFWVIGVISQKIIMKDD